MLKIFSFLIVVLALTSSCSSNPAGSPSVSNFTMVNVRSCESVDLGMPQPDAGAPAASTLDVALLGNMECVSWNLQSHSLHLEILNLAGDCLTRYSAQALATSEGLEVDLTGDCNTSNCDWCSDSFTMDVAADTLPAAINISEKNCPTDEVDRSGRVVLHETAGTACRYFSGINPPLGTIRAHCRGAGSPLGPSCDNGYSCEPWPETDAGSYEDYCMPGCSTDADCLQVESCALGVCQLNADSTW
jgi:hypothetical protein